MVATQDAHIIAITETWLNRTVLDSEILPPHFCIHRKDREETRADTRGGGLLLAIDCSLPSRRRCDLEPSCEILVAELTPSRRAKLALVLCYRPPGSDRASFFQCFEQTLFHVSREFSYVCVLGDFNLPHIDWNEPITCLNAVDNAFIHIVYSFSLSQLNLAPSNDHNNVLDLVFCNSPDLINDLCNLESVFPSDHNVLSFTLSVAIANRPRLARNVYNFKRANIEQLQHIVAYSGVLESMLNCTNVDSMYDNWQDTVTLAIDTCVPKVQIRNSRDPPWFDSEARHIVNRKHTAWRRAKSQNTEATWSRYRRIRNETRILLKAKHNSYIASLDQICKDNPKRFWSFFRSKTKSHALPTVLMDGDRELTSPLEKANLFNEYFCSVFTQPDLDALPVITDPTEVLIPDPTFTADHVMSVLKNLDVNTAFALGDLSPFILKHCSISLAPSLACLFNASLLSGCVPLCWKRANIVPIHKKGDKHNVSNYRPISLLNSVSKVMERCIVNYLYPFLRNVIHPYQHGFMRGRSCSSQLLKVYHNIGKILDRGGQVDIVYLDFSKAFDSISHNLILYKLKYLFGFSEQLLSWMHSYLSQRTQRVVVEGVESSWCPVSSGVPQGSNVGPLLFLLFINDLPNAAPNSTTALFADDSKCFKKIDSLSDCELLQNDLDGLHRWSQSWKMLFNASKCRVMTITRNHNPYVFNYSMNGSNLQHVGCFKDLGVVFNTKLSFNTHIDALICKSNQVNGLIKRCVGYNAPVNVKLHLYKTLTMSIMNYCSEIWSPQGHTKIKALESIQRSMTKYILNDYDMSYVERCVELELLPLTFRREINDLLFAFKIIHNLVAVDFNEEMHIVSPSHSRTAHGILLEQRHVRTETFYASYFNRIVHLWNILPLDIRTSQSLCVFKQNLSRFYQCKFRMNFNTDILCTWTSTCRCSGFYH